MSTAAIDQFDELPRINGPKLRRFKDGNYNKIEYEQLLDRGDHGYVFRVRIDGELYTLTLFQFFDLREALAMLDPASRSQVSQEDIEGQKDPFNAECRAYGRIALIPRKTPIAIACHGFISIPAKQESFFAQKFNISDWNRPKEELSLPPAKRQPFRALVKTLVETEPKITMELIEQIRRELVALNRGGVFVMGLEWDKYRGGHLAGFSSAWTKPHFEFREDVNSKGDIKMNTQIDLAAFKKMVQELGMGRTGLRPR